MIVDQARSMREDIVLFNRSGYGMVMVPSIPHKGREYGGHLMVKPAGDFNHVSDMLAKPDVWCRYHLLCAIAEKAMLEVLPSLNGELATGKVGIINLVEAGNWGVHFHRDPVGLKDAESKTVHAHLYGRSILELCAAREEKTLHWGWGEAPRFPKFVDTPFSSPRPDKDWIVPEQFNENECDLLSARIAQLFQVLKNTCP